MIHALRLLALKSLVFLGVLSVVSCDQVDQVLGDHKKELDMIQALEFELNQKIHDVNQQIAQAKSKHAAISYNLESLLSGGSINTYGITPEHFDKLMTQKRSVERIYFTLVDMQKELSELKKTQDTLIFQYDAFQKQLEEFKQAHALN